MTVTLPAPPNSAHSWHDALPRLSGRLHQILLLYCTIFYFIPFLFYLAYGPVLERNFVWQPNYVLGFVFVLFFIGTFLLYDALVMHPRWRKQRSTPEDPVSRGLRFVPRIWLGGIMAPNLIFLLSLVFLGLSLWAWWNLGLNFRHSGLAITDFGQIGIVFVLLKTVSIVAIGVQLQSFVLTQGQGSRYYAPSFAAFACAFVLSAQSAYDMFYVFMAIVALSRCMLKVYSYHISAFRVILMMLFVPVVFFAMLFVGVANKYGIDTAISLMASEDFIADTLLMRLSVHFYSTANAVTSHMLDFALGMKALGEVLQTTTYRLGALLGGAVDRPDIGSVARMNFLSMSESYHERIGTTPSLIGGMFYAPGAVLAMIYYIPLLHWFLRFLDRFGPADSRTWWLNIYLVLLLGGVFDSLLDALNPLSPAFVTLVFLIAGSQQLRRTEAAWGHP